MIAADAAQERQHEVVTVALHQPQQREADAADRERDRIDGGVVGDADGAPARTDCRRSAGMPVNAVSWLRMIMIAAALMKPAITGWLSRLTMPPICVMRSSHNVMPDCRQIVAVTPRYASENAGGVRAHRFGDHDRDHRDGTDRQTLATNRARHRAAAARRSHRARPAAGRPARNAYAIACGTVMTLTTSPANRSWLRSRRL